MHVCVCVSTMDAYITSNTTSLRIITIKRRVLITFNAVILYIYEYTRWR